MPLDPYHLWVSAQEPSPFIRPRLPFNVHKVVDGMLLFQGCSTTQAGRRLAHGFLHYFSSGTELGVSLKHRAMSDPQPQSQE